MTSITPTWPMVMAAGLALTIPSSTILLRESRLDPIVPELRTNQPDNAASLSICGTSAHGGGSGAEGHGRHSAVPMGFLRPTPKPDSFGHSYDAISHNRECHHSCLEGPNYGISQPCPANHSAIGGGGLMAPARRADDTAPRPSVITLDPA